MRHNIAVLSGNHSRHPRGWCGLKCRQNMYLPADAYSRHPRGWCGLKYVCCLRYRAEQWSPPARVVWIEMEADRQKLYDKSGRHPRGWCGLKSTNVGNASPKSAGRHPRGWCGLKCSLRQVAPWKLGRSPPARVVWIEIFITLTASANRPRRHPRGWCGLKLTDGCKKLKSCLVATREGGVD